MSLLGTRIHRGVSLLPFVAACGGPLPGFYWELDQVVDTDTCHSSPVPADDALLEYRLAFDVNDVTLAIGEDEFAQGSVQGCTIAYSTVVWPDERDGFRIAWQMNGSASISRGGTDGCSIGNGTDWDGTETFTVVTSEDPNLQPGCQYTVQLSGSYIQEVQ